MTKCYSVRLKEFVQISPKCYKAISYDGTTDLIPKSQYFGRDYDVSKSKSYWISAWILERKKIQYSTKKWTNFSKNGKNIGQIEFTHHKPKKLNPKTIEYDDSLIRPTEES